MKIKTKLYLGFGSILLIVIILMGILAGFLGQLQKNTGEIVTERMEKLRLTNRIQQGICFSELKLMELVITGNYSDDTRTEIEKLQYDVAYALDSYSKIATSQKGIALLSRLDQMNHNYMQLQEEILKHAEAGNKAEATQLLFHEGKNLRSQIIQITAELNELQKTRTEELYSQFVSTVTFAGKIMYVVVITSLILGLVLTYLFVRSITGSFQKLIRGINSIAYGDKDKLPRLEMDGDSEIKEIVVTINDMATALEEQNRTQKEYLQTVEQQNWLNYAVAEISMLCQGVQNLDTMAALLINKVTPMAGASYGVIYIKDFQDPRYFRKYAAYAETGGKPGVDIIKPGEGLAGQCALENKTIIVTEVPENYIKVSSGLGRTPSASIILLPVEFESQVVGVIELATLKRFTELQLALFEQILGNIGIVINSIINHMTIQQLLEESKSMTEELQSQSEELQSQQEELRSINEELHEQNRCSEEKTRELEKIKSTLEEKTRQLTLTSEYKSEFLANMSHELRTPLNSLLILAQLFKENPDGNLSHQQVEYACAMYSAGNELLALINNILDLSKIESGKMEVESDELLLEELENYFKSQFSAIAEQKGIEFNIRISDNIPTVLYTDEQKLKQVLNNLLSNAIKFTDSGTVVLDIKRVNEQMVAMSVIDSGIGIPQDKVPIIFESFKQADGTTSRKYGGTGLGLSISKELAQLLGGHIEVETEEGKGSTFTLYLPITGYLADPVISSEDVVACSSLELPSLIHSVKSEDGYTGKIPDDQKELLEGKKILIVDDDMRNVFAITTVLERHSIKVLFAEHGKESIEVLKDNPDVDLILMDIMMPEMDGYDTIRYIRQIPEYKQLPIIAVTAKAMKGDRQKCIDAGASDYISKPINVEQLYSLILVWLCK